MTDHKPEQPTEKTPRLPCRGCMPDCQYYHQCDGAPWRKKLNALSLAPSSEPIEQ